MWCFTTYCGGLSDGNQENFCLSDFLSPLPSGAHNCGCAFLTSILSSDISLSCTRLWFYFCSCYYRGFLATSCFFSAFMRIWPFFFYYFLSVVGSPEFSSGKGSISLCFVSGLCMRLAHTLALISALGGLLLPWSLWKVVLRTSQSGRN